MSNVQNTHLNQKKLLQKQQISQDKINQLLELSSQELICGPDCQQKKYLQN